MRRARAEAFFEDEENFLWPEASAPIKPPWLALPSDRMHVNTPASTNDRNHTLCSTSATVPLPAIPYVFPPAPAPSPTAPPVIGTSGIFISGHGQKSAAAPVLTRDEIVQVLEGNSDWPTGLLGPYDLELEDLNALRLVFLMSCPREDDLVAHRSLIAGRDIGTLIERLEKGGLIVRMHSIRLSEMGLSLIRGEWDGLPGCRDPERDPSTVMLAMLVELSRARCGHTDSTGYQTAPLTDEGIPYSLQACRDRLVQHIDSMPSADRVLRMHVGSGDFECAIALFENVVIAQKVAFLRFLDDVANHLKSGASSPFLGAAAKLQIRAAEVISLFEARARSSTLQMSR